MGIGDDFEPTPLLAILKERREHVNSTLEFYIKNLCTLHWLADALGANELDTVVALARLPTGIVKCCKTTPAEFEQALRGGIGSELLVLDTSAIVTLTLLEGWSYLDRNKRYIVSRATREHVECWRSNPSEQLANEGGHISITADNQPVFQRTTEAQREVRRRGLENIRRMIETHCECRSSEAVAALDPEKRKDLEQVAGYHNVESVCLAKELGAVLWTDDLGLSLIAKTEFGVNSVWTQLALRCFVDGSHFTMEDFNLVSAKLAAWNYTDILWNADTIISAGEYVNWDIQPLPVAIARADARGADEGSALGTGKR